jgi:hypothetical protein
MSNADTLENLVDAYVRENKTSEAVSLLYELIVSSAKSRNFKKAEMLHEKLYEVDPMALTEIIRAGEAIDEAKNQSVDTQYRSVWTGLYDGLSKNEGNALYYGMEHLKFEAGDVIIEQGQVSNRLFFINKGCVKAVYSRDRQELLLGMLEAGDFFGNDQFFTATVSTLSMIAQGSVKASCLDAGITKKWKTEAPALESKLFDYSLKHDRIKQLIDSQGKDRREYSRVHMPLKMVFQFFDTSGKLTNKAYRGEISDVSEGGLSFFIKTSKPDAIRMMLGRRIFVSFHGNAKYGDGSPIEKNGQVIAVQSQMFDDFSIHVKFDTPMGKRQFDSLIRG